MTKKINIEKKLDKLKNILEKFENNEYDLDSSIEQYKTAVEIVDQLEKELNKRELELNEIRSEIF